MILSLLLCVARLQEPAFLPVEWISRQSFQRLSLNPDPKRIQATYRSLERLWQFTLTVQPQDRRLPRDLAQMNGPYSDIQVPIDLFRNGLVDGLPLGTSVRISIDPRRSHLAMAFRSDWTFAYLTLSGNEYQLGQTGFENNGEAFAEALARQTLARVEARRLTHEGRKLLGATEVSTNGTPETELVDLTDWAKARGWTLKVDDCVATLTKNERKLRVPLGALAVEVDGKWKDLPEVVMLQNDRWWVPLDALEAAVKRSDRIGRSDRARR